MAKINILVVEDEKDIQELIKFNLKQEGYAVQLTASGEDALKVARAELPKLILLDLMLPGLDGLQVCRLLKSDPKTMDIPIIMVTAKGEESDVVVGLELGAEDYVSKPFSPKVLITRIRTVLRRNAKKADTEQRVVAHGDLLVDPTRHEVMMQNERVDLTASEFKLLYFLVNKPGWVFTRHQIVDAVKGEDYAVTERSVDVQIVGLRRKLGECAHYIETVRGVGYRFRE